MKLERGGANPTTDAFFRRKIKPFKEYRKMTRKELLKLIRTMRGTYSRLRGLYGDKCLECDYLNRRLRQLESR